MLLHTMNDEEKIFECYKSVRIVYEYFRNIFDDIKDKFNRGTRFPYVQRYQVKDDRNNLWYMILCCPSKAARKKGLFFALCYTIYEIPPKITSSNTRKNDKNSGKGCIAYDFVKMYNFINNHERDDIQIATFIDIVPHVFNRYTKRYLKPKGLENISFGKKVESILLRWRHFDISADLNGDINTKKHLQDDDIICPYDIVMDDGSLMRGHIVNSLLVRFYTYINNDMMFEEQKERSLEMLNEYSEWLRTGKFVKKMTL